MSKGAGGIGIGSVRAQVVRAIGRRGGLHRIVDSSGMREESSAWWRARFRAASDVNELARTMPPVRVSIYREGGRNVVTIEDGRHRLAAARAAGATRIAVEARVVGERGGSSARWTGMVRV